MIYAVIDTNVIVAGNMRHYPISPIVVTPAEMVKLIDAER